MLGQRIRSQRKMFRYLARAFCPTDGRLVAAAVAFEGEAHIWTTGGRSASNADRRRHSLSTSLGAYIRARRAKGSDTVAT